VYLDDARETLPHSAIQVAGSELLGLSELPILQGSSHSGKWFESVRCLLLIDAWRITGKLATSSRPAARYRTALTAVADRPDECTDMSDMQVIVRLL
jgi:hypothetical protein